MSVVLARSAESSSETSTKGSSSGWSSGSSTVVSRLPRKVVAAAPLSSKSCCWGAGAADPVVRARGAAACAGTASPQGFAFSSTWRRRERAAAWSAASRTICETESPITTSPSTARPSASTTAMTLPSAPCSAEATKAPR